MKVETEELLSIGRFARWSGLTVKALRHMPLRSALRTSMWRRATRGSP